MNVMHTMADGCVDMVFTSPPYNLSTTASGNPFNTKTGIWKSAKIAHGYDSYSDALPYAEYVEWQKAVLSECWRLLSDDGAIFYQHKPRVQGGILQTPLDLNPGLPVRQIVIWNRKSGFNFSPCFYLPTCEWIVIFAKPKWRLKSRSASGAKDVWDITHERNNEHPAPFPIALPHRAIESTNAKVIFDPFAGSGTTLLAASRLGRQSIGIELDVGYFDMACDRLRADAPLSV